jgi:glucosamine 6-phosphate synthetase-like amidotransferase/phosphosugar isomerase protein
LGDILNPLLYILPLQLLGYYNALSKNLNPDHPRNLTAVVEFEI